MRDERFSDAFDACRPGSRDLDEPEMAALADALASDPVLRAEFEASCRLDVRLSEAFAAVPVPVGLADRLLANLRTSTLQTAAAEATAAAASILMDARTVVVRTPASPIDRLAQLPPVQRVSRRRIVLAAAAALLVTTGAWVALHVPSSQSSGELTSDAADWFAELGDAWQPPAQAPADLPLASAIVGRVRGWQPLARSIAKRGVVYSLAQGAKSRAVLFVLPGRRAGLPPTAPFDPQSATGGLSISAWQSQGLVYVLVVEGDPRAYRRLLNPGRQPLA
ncbi:MAG TPA: hypothetical protein VMF30_06900 [Pirellulales bacterium]|nr:hypothetical protein [Pirellulales bacterium]